jgi:hypothetical protein
LIGVNNDVVEVENWTINEFSISCDVVTRKDGFKCRLRTVYGSVYEEKNRIS